MYFYTSKMSKHLYITVLIHPLSSIWKAFKDENRHIQRDISYSHVINFSHYNHVIKLKISFFLSIISAYPYLRFEQVYVASKWENADLVIYLPRTEMFSINAPWQHRLLQQTCNYWEAYHRPPIVSINHVNTWRSNRSLSL